MIIAGGRDYEITLEDEDFLDTLVIDMVISGCAKGADQGGEFYAISRDIPIKHFPANWDKFGKSAGHKRNEQMAKFADAVVLFPGGAGTNDMKLRVKNHGLVIYEPYTKSCF